MTWYSHPALYKLLEIVDTDYIFRCIYLVKFLLSLNKGRCYVFVALPPAHAQCVKSDAQCVLLGE